MINKWKSIYGEDDYVAASITEKIYLLHHRLSFLLVFHTSDFISIYCTSDWDFQVKNFYALSCSHVTVGSCSSGISSSTIIVYDHRRIGLNYFRRRIRQINMRNAVRLWALTYLENSCCNLLNWLWAGVLWYLFVSLFLKHHLSWRYQAFFVSFSMECLSRSTQLFTAVQPLNCPAICLEIRLVGWIHKTLRLNCYQSTS